MCGLNLPEKDKADFGAIKQKMQSNDELHLFSPANSKENIRDKLYEELDSMLLGMSIRNWSCITSLRKTKPITNLKVCGLTKSMMQECEDLPVKISEFLAF